MRSIALFRNRSFAANIHHARYLSCRLVVLALVGLILLSSSVISDDAIDAILKIQQGGSGIPSATAAAAELNRRGISLEELIGKAAGANPVSKNWILSIAQSMGDRMPADQSRQSLEKLLADKQADGELRYWALDRLSDLQPGTREQRLDGRTDDPSLDIRYEAIEAALKKLPAPDSIKDDDGAKKQAISSYRKLLDSSRLPDQMTSINAKLKELDSEVDMRQHFGFVSSWQVIGPFESRNTAGYDIVYPPEAEYLQNSKVTVSQKYEGKAGQVTWQAASSDKPDGVVDLNAIYANEKGAAIYGYAVIQSPVAVDCQVRFGSANANKVWVNGTEVSANNVYHTGSAIDQYLAPVQLKRGPNTVLIKVCQNEQTEPWAQDFGFKLRFTDATGLAIPVTQ